MIGGGAARAESCCWARRKGRRRLRHPGAGAAHDDPARPPRRRAGVLGAALLAEYELERSRAGAAARDRRRRLRPRRGAAAGADPAADRAGRSRAARPRHRLGRATDRLPGQGAGGRPRGRLRQADRGIIVCGSGAGVSVAAGKIKRDPRRDRARPYTAHQGVEHDDINVICMGGRVIGTEMAAEIVHAFLAAAVQRRGATRPPAGESRRDRADRRRQGAEIETWRYSRPSRRDASGARRPPHGITDLPLTGRGRGGPRRLAPPLAERSFALVLCSPLRRARETCELAGFGDVAENRQSCANGTTASTRG